MDVLRRVLETIHSAEQTAPHRIGQRIAVLMAALINPIVLIAHQELPMKPLVAHVQHVRFAHLHADTR